MRRKLYIVFLFLFILSFSHLKAFSQENTENSKVSDSLQAQNKTSSPGFKREYSQARKIYNSVKDGVVTVTGGRKHGSGFLVDEKGLILTNHHVVDGIEDRISVRFGENQVVKGFVLVKDAHNDVAVVWVNLKNIEKYSVLKMFTPKPNEPLVVPGEKVLAIGSPLIWAAYEKTLTQGIISKYSDLAIMHDASIAGGNSGGPLLNFAGYVIGLNTFHPNAEDNASMSGSVSILKAIPFVISAAQKIKTLTPPPEELIPGYSNVSYDNKIMALAYQKESINERSRCEPYTAHSKDYDIKIVTPFQTYRDSMRTYNGQYKNFFKEKRPVIVNSSCEYIKPVVSLVIQSKLKQTKASKIINILRALSGMSSRQQYNRYSPPLYICKYVYKKDFKALNLVNPAKKKIYMPYDFSRHEVKTNEKEDKTYKVKIIRDNTHLGYYEFDPRYFDTKDELVLKIFSEKSRRSVKVKISPEIKKYIVDDFRPYWEYLKSRKTKL